MTPDELDARAVIRETIVGLFFVASLIVFCALLYALDATPPQ